MASDAYQLLRQARLLMKRDPDVVAAGATSIITDLEELMDNYADLGELEEHMIGSGNWREDNPHQPVLGYRPTLYENKYWVDYAKDLPGGRPILDWFQDVCDQNDVVFLRREEPFLFCAWVTTTGSWAVYGRSDPDKSEYWTLEHGFKVQEDMATDLFSALSELVGDYRK